MELTLLKLKHLQLHKPLNLLSNKNGQQLLPKTFFCCIAFTLLAFIGDTKINAYEKLGVYLQTNCLSIIQELDTVQYCFKTGTRDIKCHFEKARRYYKEIEFAVEFASPFHAKYYINGPPIKKSEIEYGNRVFEPHGFQLLENFIYGSDSSLTKQQLVYEVVLLKDALNQIKNKFKSYALKDEVILEMLKLQTIRIVSLNLCGYDCAISKLNVREAYYSLAGIKTTLEIYQPFIKDKTIFSSLSVAISKAQNYLLKNTDYNNFDRLNFIVNYFKPIYKLITVCHQHLKLPYSPVNYAINFKEPDFFSDRIFNRNYFSVNLIDSALVNEQAELGKFLFFDPVLSGNNKRACASCHKPEFGFGDTIKTNLKFNSLERLSRNTPSLINAFLQKVFFYDGRSLQMEDQVSDVLHNINEMNSNPVDIVDKLKLSNEYKQLFKKAYKGTADTTITFYSVLKAITEYEKSLIGLNSKFDKYIKGNTKTLTSDEMNGFNLFSGKALCGTCHFFPLFNGLVPPVFNDSEFEVIGVPDHFDNKRMDADSGRYKISKHMIHLHAFKTPSIRNINLTAPYMHNGVYKDLDQVLEFYKKGGGVGLGFNLPHQTLPFDTLTLTKIEIKNIKAFLTSLTDTSSISAIPKRLPKFDRGDFDKRKIGGEY